MNSETFRFKVGRFDCVAISDGAFNYPLESMFANVPGEQIVEVLRQHNLPTDRITTPYTCLLVNTGQHQVLIDTEAGSSFRTRTTSSPELSGSFGSRRTRPQKLLPPW